jgi:hypothetical protein
MFVFCAKILQAQLFFCSQNDTPHFFAHSELQSSKFLSYAVLQIATPHIFI